MTVKKTKKKQSIRNNEYYNTQVCFDQLYQDSLQGKRFTQLMDIITSEENIMLAYRSIKKNKGSRTKGTNNSTIIQMGEKAPDELISYVRKRLQNFHPHCFSVRQIGYGGKVRNQQGAADIGEHCRSPYYAKAVRRRG